MKIEIGRDWSEFLRLLISHRVRFVLVGGHAVAGHGEPRLTADLDVFVDATPTNARRLREVLTEFGFGDSAPSARELSERGKIWMLGRKPWRIDILTLIDGVTFRQAWQGHVEVPFDPAPLPVIGLAELLRNKRAAGRPKDLADVAALEALRADRAARAAPPRRTPKPTAARSKAKARRRRPPP